MRCISRFKRSRPVHRGASAVRNIWIPLSRLSWTLLIVGVSSCAHNPAQSWDQQNLKRNDIADCIRGNPVFIAPGGVLEQC